MLRIAPLGPSFLSHRWRSGRKPAASSSGAAATATTPAERTATSRADRRTRWLLAATRKGTLARVGAWGAVAGLATYGGYALLQLVLQHGAAAASTAAAAVGASAPTVTTVAASNALPLAAIVGIAVGATLAAVVLLRLAWLGVRQLRARARDELAAQGTDHGASPDPALS